MSMSSVTETNTPFLVKQGERSFLQEAKLPGLQLSCWWAGRESNPDLQLRTLPCCSVTLPTHLELAPGIQPGSLR
jgi:hypothetical protein